MSILAEIQAEFEQVYLEKRQAVASIALCEQDYQELNAEVAKGLVPPDEGAPPRPVVKLANFACGNLVDVLVKPDLKPREFVLEPVP